MLNFRHLLAVALLALWVGAADAQTTQTSLCVPIPPTSGNPGASCPPVTDSNPLPVDLTAGGTGGLALESTSQDILTELNTLVAQAIPSCTGTAVVTAAAADSLVLKASAGDLCGVYATNLTATPGFLMVVNATSEPADGAVTPIECVPLPSNGVAGVAYGTGFASSYSTGITAFVSYSTTCFTKTTTGVSAFIKGQVLP